MNEKINKIPINYEDWLDLGHVIIPTDQKKARVSWKKDDFSLTKEDVITDLEHTYKDTLEWKEFIKKHPKFS